MVGRSPGASISTCCFISPSWSLWWFEEFHPICTCQETGSESYILGYAESAGAGISTQVCLISKSPAFLSYMVFGKEVMAWGRPSFHVIKHTVDCLEDHRLLPTERWHGVRNDGMGAGVWPLGFGHWLCHSSVSDLGQVINSLSFPYVE